MMTTTAATREETNPVTTNKRHAAISQPNHGSGVGIEIQGARYAYATVLGSTFPLPIPCQLQNIRALKFRRKP